MTDATWIERFYAACDAVITQRPVRLPENAPAALRDDLEFARRLAEVDFSPQSQARAPLRRQLAARTRGSFQETNVFRPTWNARLAWPVFAIVALVLLAVYQQPVMAAVQRAFGYGYLPQAGFFRLDGAQTLAVPTPAQTQTAVAVTQGLATGGETFIWLSGLPADAQLGQIELSLSDGRRIPSASLEPAPGNDPRLGRRVAFANLSPDRLTGSVLRVAEVDLPLEWVPAGQAGLAPTQVSNITWQAESDALPCAQLSADAAVCVEAAYVDEQAARVLVRGADSAGTASLDGACLEDEARRIYPLERRANDGDLTTLYFASLPASIQTVTLNLTCAAGSSPIRLTFRLPERLPALSPTPSANSALFTPRPAATPAAP